MKQIYYLYADLGGTYCENYAATKTEAKKILQKWMFNDGFFGPTPKSCIQVYKISEEMRKQSCVYRLQHGKRLRFDVEGIKISLK